MTFVYAPEHETLRAELRTFFEHHAPSTKMAQLDRSETYPAEIYQAIAERGWCGVTIRAEFGGGQLDEVALCLIGEEVTRAGASLQYAYIPTIMFCARAIANYGSQQQKHDILPGIAEGRIRFAIAMTEPDAGSDLQALKVTGTMQGETVVVRGVKMFSTGADVADYILVLVRTDGPDRHGHTVVVVPRDAPGLTIEPLLKFSGQGTKTCMVHFDDVVVSRDAVIGEVGGGLEIIFSLLDSERINVGAQALGIAQGALDTALEFARQRVQFGKPIIAQQAIAHKLVDMHLRVEAARGLIYSTAQAYGSGTTGPHHAAMAKVIGSETATRVVQDGMQIMGGRGYLAEFGMERWWREVKVNEIAGGTNQVLRTLISKHL